jgi:riboflavin kinase/FMN adenylyltransferase
VTPVYYSLEEGSEGLKGAEALVLTIGNFDGVHLGHQHLIRSTLDTADRLRATPFLLTFDPHPQLILRGSAPPLLCTLPQKIAWITELGMKEVIVQPFSRSFAELSPEAFLERLKVLFPHLRGIVVGHDFRFGRSGKGDFSLLSAWGSTSGVEVREVPPWTLHGRPVSSSLIRSLLSQGDVAQARLLLGRPWQVWGKPGRGAGRGKTLGFPTINLVTENPIVVPDGVYGGRMRIGDRLYVSAISVGTNPTFGEEARRAEAHLLGFSDPLDHGRELKLEFLTYLRAQVRFFDLSRLITQMEADVAIIQEQAHRERWLDLP